MNILLTNGVIGPIFLVGYAQATDSNFLYIPDRRTDVCRRLRMFERRQPAAAFLLPAQKVSE